VSAFREPRLDLLARAVDEHELHAERGEEVQVVRKVVEAPVGREIAAERDDEDLAAKSVDVRRDRLEPVDEAVLAGQALTPRRRRIGRDAVPRWRVLSFRNWNTPARTVTPSMPGSPVIPDIMRERL
jgi:hypothetical protein